MGEQARVRVGDILPATWRVAVVYFIGPHGEAVRPGEDVPGLWEGEAPQRAERAIRPGGDDPDL